MPAHDAIRGEILRLADRDLDRYDFAREAARVLRRAVPFDAMAGVWFDPETGLPVDEWIDNSLAGGAGSRLPEIGLHETDITAFRQLAASGRPAGSMSEATGGTLDRSRRPRGLGDELRSVYFGDSGMWCGYVMYRERGAPDFAGREVDLIASLNGGRPDLHRVRLQQDLSSDVGDGDPGLLLLDHQDGVEMANPAAAAWLDELRARRRRLPVVVSAVAQRAREIASGDSGLAATARARTASGRWITVRGWVLQNGSEARTAITLEPARGPDLAELLADAHGLTACERRVSKLVAQGLPNAAIAARLYLSTYTVQDHLKSIFAKLDVSNRGQLVARLFLDPYMRSAGA
jgi:DNA-binding CsgD family transcriptional regulator